MIGRAGLGNPWALGAIARGEPDPRPAAGEVIAELEHFARDIADLMGEARACHYLRKFHSWYLAGRGLPEDEVQALMEDATLDEALARLRAMRGAAPATADGAAS
jgi:tRNA-dihydrouridine synthase